MSGRVKLVKPDPAIYREMHARIEPHLPGIAPHELVFIDDNAKNAAAATALGWHGIHHTSAATTERGCANWARSRKRRASSPPSDKRPAARFLL